MTRLEENQEIMRIVIGWICVAFFALLSLVAFAALSIKTIAVIFLLEEEKQRKRK